MKNSIILFLSTILLQHQIIIGSDLNLDKNLSQFNIGIGFDAAYLSPLINVSYKDNNIGVKFKIQKSIFSTTEYILAEYGLNKAMSIIAKSYESYEDRLEYNAFLIPITFEIYVKNGFRFDIGGVYISRSIVDSKNDKSNTHNTFGAIIGVGYLYQINRIQLDCSLASIIYDRKLLGNTKWNVGIVPSISFSILYRL